jgi:hypothetical protein
MGVDLCKYGNHNIVFEGRDIVDTACEIKGKLNRLKLENEDALRRLLLEFHKSPPVLEESLEAIDRIKTKKEWDFTIEEDEGYRSVCFSGLLDFELEFTRYKIYFDDLPYRYFLWFYTKDKSRNELRNYMRRIVRLFGGDRVIYLPDTMLDSAKYLDLFDGIDSPFKEIEEGLIKEYGKTDKKLHELTEYDDVLYYIDDFKDLDI